MNKKIYWFIGITLLLFLMLVSLGCAKHQGVTMTSDEAALQNGVQYWQIYINNNSSRTVQIVIDGGDTDFVPGNRPRFPSSQTTITLAPSEETEIDCSPRTDHKTNAFSINYTFVGATNVSLSQRILAYKNKYKQNISSSTQGTDGTYTAVASECNYQDTQTFDVDTLARDMVIRMGIDPDSRIGRILVDAFKHVLNRWLSRWSIQCLNYSIGLTDYTN